MEKSLPQKALETFKQKGAKEFVHKSCGVLSRLAKPISNKIEPALYPYAAWRISREIGKKQTALSVTSFLFDKLGHLIKPKQIRWEITELAKIVENLKPKVVVEIGTARGGTLFAFSRLATPTAIIVSIDLPWGGTGDYPTWREKIYQKFSSPEQKLTLMRADSHQQETLEKLESVLGGRDIDFLFIDGDHTYGGVKKDYELYSPLVRVGGVIALHDVAKHNATPNCEVDRFWDEIRATSKSQEFISVPPQNWGGIGVVYK